MDTILHAGQFLYQNAGTIIEALSAFVGAAASLCHVFHEDGANAFFDKVTGLLATAASYFKK